MSDDEYFVSNAVGHLTGDLDSDDLYGRLTTAERTAALLWVMDGRIRMDGIGGWIETHGQRSDDALEALRLVGATRFAAAFQTALALIPTRSADDPDTRLSAMDSWTPAQAESWRQTEDEYLAINRRDDLVDNYLRPFVTSHPEDFRGLGRRPLSPRKRTDLPLTACAEKRAAGLSIGDAVHGLARKHGRVPRFAVCAVPARWAGRDREMR